MSRIVSPFPTEHLPKLWELCEHFRSFMLDDYSPQTLEDLRLFTQKVRSYALLAENGVLLGGLMFEPMGDEMYVGHLVFAHAGLSSSAKLNASAIVLDKLFASGARKVSWRYFGDNEPFRKFLMKLGAETEGRLKQATRRKGELCDVILMASFPK